MNTTDLLKHVTQNWKVTGIQIDSRKVTPGDLFVCISGYTVDGHDFAKEAQKNGAVGIVAERYVEGIQIPQVITTNTAGQLPILAKTILQAPSASLRLFGIVGTNGKTTTAYMLEHLLGTFERDVGYIGTNGIRYGDKFFESVNTTPNALALQETFVDMLQAGTKNVSMEVSSHALAEGRVDTCQFKVAVFTNLTPEHLDFHANMESYFESKYKLFTMIEEDGYGIVNIDDAYGCRIYQRLKACGINVFTYSMKQEADFVASDVRGSHLQTVFTLTYQDKSYPVTLPIPGAFNVYNAMSAIASVVVVGLPIVFATEKMAQLSPIDGRMEMIDAGQDFAVMVDYAHFPDGLAQVLDFAKESTTGKVFIVFGCPGDRDRSKRPVMARLAVEKVDRVIFTTDDPHSEDPLVILEEMTKGLYGDNYEKIVDRRMAMEQALKRAKKGDMVIIAGRGHQKVQYVKGGNKVFDDREVARDILQKLRKVKEISHF